MNVLVMGATGNIGSELIRQLNGDGVEPRAFFRDTDKAALLLDGCSYVPFHGSFSDQEVVREALQGVHSFFVPSVEDSRFTDDLAQIIQVALAERVKRVVLVTTMGIDPEMKDPISRFKGTHERLVRESGLDYVMIQPDFFHQNIFFMYPGPDMIFHMGDMATYHVDVRDMAAVCQVVLTSDAHSRESLVMQGPEALGWADLAEILCEETDLPFHYTPIEVEDYAKLLRQNGVTELSIELLCSLPNFASNGIVDHKRSNDIDRVLGRPAISFRQFVRDFRDDIVAQVNDASATT